MITTIIIFISKFIMDTISHSGYVGVAILMAIESAAVPLPSEIIMPFSGSLVNSGRFSLFWVAVAGAIGSTIGSWITYWLGKYGGRPLVEKYGKYILISHHDLDAADKFFKKYGAWSTFFGRILPVFRTYISVPAGISRVNFGLFTFTSLTGSFLWSLFLAWLGIKLGENWKILENYFRKFDILILVIGLTFVVFWVWRHVKNSKR